MYRGILSFVGALALATSAHAQSAAASPPPIEDYGRLPAVDHVSLSPSGALLAFIAKVGDQRRLVIVDSKNTLIGAQPIGAMKVESVDWAGDEFVLIYHSATIENGIEFVDAKSELGGVLVLNLKTHKVFPVFADKRRYDVANVVTGEYGVAQVKGRWAGFFGGFAYDRLSHIATTEDGHIVPNLYRVDLETGEIALAAAGELDLHTWLVAPDGSVAARLLYDRQGGDWKLISGPELGRTLAQGRSPLGGPVLRGFGRTADTVVLETHAAAGSVFQEIPLGAGQARTIGTEDDFESVLFDGQSKRLIGVVLPGDRAVPAFYDPTANARVKGALKAFPNHIPHLVDSSSDFRSLVVRTDGGDDSGAFWFVDIGKGSAKVVGTQYPTITPASVGPVRMIDYKAADGMALHAVLTLPPDRPARNLPVVVMPHGGPEARDYPGFDYWAQAFASRGYAVLQPNFRGSDGYGQAYREAGFGEWGRKMQTDLSDGLAELGRQGLVDPRRACIVGASYGGYAAEAGVTVQHGVYRCAVSYGGVADPLALVNAARSREGGVQLVTRYWKTLLGADKAGADLTSISPVKLAARADAPMLLIHGTDDTVVPIAQSQALERALKAAGKPVELMTLKGADHWLLEEDGRIAMVKASVEFVAKNNPADAAPAR